RAAPTRAAPATRPPPPCAGTPGSRSAKLHINFIERNPYLSTASIQCGAPHRERLQVLAPGSASLPVEESHSAPPWVAVEIHARWASGTRTRISRPRFRVPATSPTTQPLEPGP